MEEYANKSGRSGIIAYEIGKDFIVIEYRSGEQRTYTYDENGVDDVEELKSLAKAGEGLNRYLIETHK